MQRRRSDLAMLFTTYASPSSIPSDATVGIHRTATNGDTILNMWGILIEVESAVPPSEGQRFALGNGNIILNM